MAGKCTMAEIKSGVWSLSDLLKINALLDMESDMLEAANADEEDKES